MARVRMREENSVAEGLESAVDSCVYYFAVDIRNL